MSTDSFDHCARCGKPIEEGFFCEDCELREMQDPQFWLDYCHFCGIPATLEQVKRWMEGKS